MPEKKTSSTRRIIVAVSLCLAAAQAGQAAVLAPLSGAIAGTVKSPGGVPQMGAQVTLYNHLQKPLGKVLTDEHGQFKLLGLVPALYSVKITFAAFVPATRQVMVQPGMRSILNVNLSTLFSNIQFGYPTHDNGLIMTDDWKWVLRSAPATRPVLRFLGKDKNTDAIDEAVGTQADAASVGASTAGHVAVFSETRGLFHVSAGDGAQNAGINNQADMGATFALATQLYGSGLVQVSGNLGYAAATGAPAAAFRTSYSREIAGGVPEVSLTVQQLMLPGRMAALANPDGSGLAQLRTMTASFQDENRISESLTLQYGMTMNEVSFLDHLNYYSPYARLTYTVDPSNQFLFGYSAGDARPNLDSDGSAPDTLRRDVDALGALPRMSMLDGRTQIQRGVEYEAVYVRKSGSRTYKASIYRQDISNAAITMATPGAPAGYFAGADILPDLFSNSSILNAGTFQSTGVAVSATQNLGDNSSVTVIYGDSGVLTAPQHEMVTNNPDELRSMIQQGRGQQLTARYSATIPQSGTHLIASYQFTGTQRSLMGGNLYSMSGMQPLPGLNIYLRQPLPGFGGRLEATADLRNVAAQGYLPLNAAGGQRILLVQNPRSVRGGLSFRF